MKSIWNIVESVSDFPSENDWKPYEGPKIRTYQDTRPEDGIQLVWVCPDMIDSNIELIKNKIETFINNNKNSSDFNTRFDNLRQEILSDVESIISEYKQKVNDSYSSVIENINEKKAESMTMRLAMRKKLIFME